MRPLAPNSASLVLAALALTSVAARAQDAATPSEDADGSAPGPTAPHQAPSRPAPPSTPAPPSAPAQLVPPHLVDAPPPTYPASHADGLAEPSVLVHVVVEADGSVGEAHVEMEGDLDFDAAAVEAVRAWRFEPARRGDTPIRAAVRVTVRFQSPVPHFDLGAPDDATSASGHEHDDPDDEAGEVDAHATHTAAEPHGIDEDVGTDDEPLAAEDDELASFEARATVDPMSEARQARAASTYDLDREVLSIAPHRDVADALNVAPGMYVARPEGDSVAPRIFLRGFDAEHGQDIEFVVGGVPINEPSHLHGQGYADFGFVMPEVLRAARVTEGVYDPRQGDFATAGTVELDLGVATRGVLASAAYGSFDTFRALALWAPPGERDETFVAATYRRTSGFGQGRAGQSGSVVAQAAWGDERLRFRVLGALAAGRSGIGGVLRREDVQNGLVGFYDLYPVPAAQGQSALSLRGLVAGFLESRGEGGSFGELGVFGGWTGFRYQANYTGYTDISTYDPDWRGRGDIIEQLDEATHLGLRGRYRTPRFTPFDWLNGFVELGVQTRLDLRQQAQNLLQAPNNQTWDRRVDASVQGVDVGAYLDADLHVGEHVRVRGGARADFLFYGIDDRLGNYLPTYRAESYIVGYRRSAAGLAAGPRATVEWTPITPLTLSVAYGEGYRSPQARLLQDGETAPYAKVWSGDVGARLHVGDHDELEASVSGFLTKLSRDIAFDASEGRLEPLGPSTRLGAAASVRVRPWPFLTGSLSVTYVHATLDAPPTPTQENPNPPYVAGQLLPYVPPFVLRADLGAHERLFDLDGQPFRGRIGAGVSVVASRPLPYGDSSEPFALLDATASVSWRGLELGVDVFNATDAKYASMEYSFASNWQTAEFQNEPGGLTSRLPARHFAAGSPFSLMVHLAVEVP